MIERSREHLSPEVLKAEIGKKIGELLKSEQFIDGRKLGGYDLPPSAINEWVNKPSLDKTRRSLTAEGDVRMILRESIEGDISIQLRVTPKDERSRMRHVFILDLSKEKLPELTTYIDRPVGVAVGDEPAPMAPFDMTTTGASDSTLEAFNNFLDQGK